MKTIDYDIFISYRRAGSSFLAKNIYDWLTRRKYRPFMDIEDLRSGAFNTKLYRTIEETEDFLLVLSPGSLDRCKNEGDWLRLEVAHALKCQQNIIPVMQRGFDWGHKLANDISSVMHFNGITADIEVFDAHMERLCDQFLRSRPHTWRMFLSGRRVISRHVPAILPERSDATPPALTQAPDTAPRTAAPLAATGDERVSAAAPAAPAKPSTATNSGPFQQVCRSLALILRFPFSLLFASARVIRQSLFNEAGQLYLLLQWQRRRTLNRCRPIICRINALEAELQKVPEDVLRQKTAAWKEDFSKIQDNEELARRLNEILPEAFAVVKNACRRLCGTEIIVRERPLTWEVIPFDVQLIGGIALHAGKITDITFGEGKVLTATLPLYLHALTGRNVHYLAFSDYLARRDSEFMSALFSSLGLTIGCIQDDLPSGPERRAQYSHDITCGTVEQFGFDYLRDHNEAANPDALMQRGHAFALVNDADETFLVKAGGPLRITLDDGKVVATITIRTYLQLYEKIAGIAGSAESEAAELSELFGLDVVPVPSNFPCQRKDAVDQICRTRREKLSTICRNVQERHSHGQPVLIGALRQDDAEALSRMFRELGIIHSVLPPSDSRQAASGQSEAEILSGAGQTGAVRIITELAGRGIDIELGAEVADRGGLHVIGCERATRRFRDNQLRDRSGCKGSPGSSTFYMSFEDELMKCLGMERFASKWEEGYVLESPWLSRGIKLGQSRFTAQELAVHRGQYFFDDVFETQRKDIYSTRDRILTYVIPAYANIPVPDGTDPLDTLFVQRQWRDLLNKLDCAWQGHIASINQLREDLNRRDWSRGDALSTYRNEAAELFERDLKDVKAEFTRLQDLAKRTPVHRIVSKAAAAVKKAKLVRVGPKVRRNDPCPCCSGKTYKQCCGK